MRVEFYRDQSGEWRWRAMAGNNRIIADSGEGYKNYVDCVNGFMLLGELFGKPFSDDSLRGELE